MPRNAVARWGGAQDGGMDFLWDWWPQASDPATKLLVAFLCGLALGAEREARDKAAGLRTMILISVGSALYLMVGEAASLVGLDPSAARVTPDPTRIGSEVVAGIGFLGAGSIIQSRGAVHGLTTAATIWVAAAVGLCAGVGLYSIAVGTTIGVLLALVFLDPLADRVRNLVRHDSQTLRFTSPRDSLTVTRLEVLLLEHGSHSGDIQCQPTPQGEMLWEVELRLRTADQLRLLESLGEVDGVRGQEKVMDLGAS